MKKPKGLKEDFSELTISELSQVKTIITQIQLEKGIKVCLQQIEGLAIHKNVLQTIHSVKKEICPNDMDYCYSFNVDWSVGECEISIIINPFCKKEYGRGDPQDHFHWIGHYIDSDYLKYEVEPEEYNFLVWLNNKNQKTIVKIVEIMLGL